MNREQRDDMMFETLSRAFEDIKKPYEYHEPVYIAPKGFKVLPVPHLCMPLGLAKELSRVEEENITMEVYKGTSCGKSESEIVTAWENLWDRVERDQEGFNNYMEALKQKYPDWATLTGGNK